jgi:hypothetical protein
VDYRELSSLGESGVTIARRVVFFLVYMCLITPITLLIVITSGAETPPEPTAAPVPTQILTAKRVFISHGENGEENWLGVRNITYNEFYALIKSWGKWELVPSPADADVVYEIRYVPDYTESPPLILTIFDPKTHTVLWSFTERVQTSGRASTGRKNFDKAMATLLEDFKSLFPDANK